MRSRSVAALVAAFVLVPAGQAAATGGGHGGGDRQLKEYAAKTWASFEAMTDERSGLPSDILNADGTRSVQTSTTNIGAYMWSAVVAERLGFIGKRELERRLERTLASVERLERPPNTGGQFYNWYDHRTGAKLTAWPPTGAPTDADPVLGGQRLAGRGSADRRELGARSSRAAPERCTRR